MINKNKLALGTIKSCVLVPCFLLPWVMCTVWIAKISPWPYCQIVFVSLLFLCSILALGLALNSYSTNKECFKVKSNYIAWTALALAAWSCVGAFFAHVPWLAWTGAPEIGIGVLWYIALGVMIIGYGTTAHTKYSNALLINIIIAAGVVSCLSFVGNVTHGFIPAFKGQLYFLNEHIIFIGIVLLGIGLLTNNKNYRPICLLLGTSIVLASTNKGGYVGVIVASIVAATTYYLHKTNKIAPAHVRSIFVLLIVGLPFYIYFVAPQISSEFYLPSLYSRYSYWHACIDALLANPTKLLIGYGWGSFTDIILAGIHKISPSVILPDLNHYSEIFLWPAVPKTWAEIGLNTNRLIEGAVGFHGHNHFVEALLATGVVGAILFTMLVTLPVMLCEKSKIIAVGFSSLALSITFCIWYEIPGTLPYLAFFWGIALPEIRHHQEKIKNIFRLLLPSLAAILFVFSLGLGYTNTLFEHTINKFTNGKTMLNIPEQDYIETAGPGGMYFALLLRAFEQAITTRPLEDKDIMMAQRFLYVASRVANPSLFMLSFELPIYDFIMNKSQDPRFNHFRKKIILDHLWENRCEVLIRRWYTRADLILPYLDWLVKQKQGEHVKKVIDNLLDKYGANPVLENYKKTLAI